MKLSTRGTCLYMGAILAAAPLHAHRPPSGAYAIRICQHVCPTYGDEGVYARGTLMLFAEALDSEEAARWDRRFEPYLPNAKPNGCFVLERVSSDAQARYPSAKTAGLVNWKSEGGHLRFSLYHAVDSGYSVSLDATLDGFEGEGGFWGDFPPTPKPEPNHVEIRWIGAADQAQCRPARWLYER